MEHSTNLTELKALSASSIPSAYENTKHRRFQRSNMDSEFEPVGVVSARIVEMLIADQKKDAA